MQKAVLCGMLQQSVFVRPPPPASEAAWNRTIPGCFSFFRKRCTVTAWAPCTATRATGAGSTFSTASVPTPQAPRSGSGWGSSGAEHFCQKALTTANAHDRITDDFERRRRTGSFQSNFPMDRPAGLRPYGQPGPLPTGGEIGRASCRERG